MRDARFDYIVVGLGLSGVSCAQYLIEQGFSIAVADSRENPANFADFHNNYPSIPYYLGPLHSDQLMQAKALVLSPGLALSTPAIQACVAQGLPVIGDIELFVRKTNAPMIAITGTNGKSTVTQLVGDMAAYSGIKVHVGGNIGTPALDLLKQPEAELYVLELSSFQLETTYSLQALVSTILNLSPDHLDRYDSYQSYINTKHRIYHNCQTAVFSRDDALTRPKQLPQRLLSFGESIAKTEAKTDEFGLIQQDNEFFLALGEEKLINVDQLKIKGKLNWLNALAALAIGYAIDLPMEKMLAALKAFKGLSHRCQWIREFHGITWYNDSKGTNVGATLAAIQGLGVHMLGKIVLIAGGQAKGAEFTSLREPMKDYVRELVLIGEDADKMESDLTGAVSIKRAENMTDAVNQARKTAQPGDVVLLSPACASFDMFQNFAHRGEVFQQCVENLN